MQDLYVVTVNGKQVGKPMDRRSAIREAAETGGSACKYVPVILTPEQNAAIIREVAADMSFLRDMCPSIRKVLK